MSGARVCVLALALCAPMPLLAEQVSEVPNPRARGSFVSDSAGVLSASEIAALDGVIGALERERGAEIAVVTVRSCEGRDVKSFATELFNRWGVGKKGADNGVLVLLAMSERRVEVETGYGVEGTLPDGKVGAILDDHAVPHFRAGRFGAGLVDAVTALARSLRQDEPVASGAARLVRVSSSAISGAIGLFALSLPFAFLFWLSRRPKKCPRCREPMRLLTEQQENAYLDKDQQFEEHLGAHDWQVWRCDNDDQTVFTTKGKLFSSYSACSACGRKTALTTSHTVRAATYASSGLSRVETRCRLPRCRHTSSHERVIPRRVRSTTTYSSSSSSWSSSSSSSFGGGSSGGGGAGRSW